MPSFNTIPKEIRAQIYAYLLSAAENKSPPDENFTEHFTFHTAILRTNTNIRGEALASFRQNHFILISTNWDKMPEALQNHQVPFHKGKLSSFRDYEMRVHVTTPFSKTFSNMLICAASLTSFTNFLRVLTLANRMSFGFNFAFGGPAAEQVPRETQRLLLSPFRYVHGPRQTCNIDPQCDPVLAKEVKAAMTPIVHWVRAAAWEVYELASAKKVVADRAYREGYLQVAHDRYTNVLGFLDACNQTNSYIAGHDDSAYYYAWKQLDIVVWADILVLRTKLGWQQGDKERYESAVAEDDSFLTQLATLDYVYKSLLVEMHKTRGVARFALRKAKGAINKSFKPAKELVPSDRSIARCLALAVSSANGCTAAQHSDRVAEMIALLPEQPLKVEPLTKKGSSVYLDTEKYILRGIGYHGDFLENRVSCAFDICLEMTNGQPRFFSRGPADEKEADIRIAKILKDVENLKAKGGLFEIWIGSGHPGEEPAGDMSWLF